MNPEVGDDPTLPSWLTDWIQQHAPQAAPADASAVNGPAQALGAARQQVAAGTGTIGPAQRGNIPLNNATIAQLALAGRMKTAGSVLMDIGRLNPAVNLAAQTPESVRDIVAGHPLPGVIGMALATLPMGGEADGIARKVFAWEHSPIADAAIRLSPGAVKSQVAERIADYMGADGSHVFTGTNHGAAVNAARNFGVRGVGINDLTEGFTDKTGAFLTRGQTYDRMKALGMTLPDDQLPNGTSWKDHFTSEDVKRVQSAFDRTRAAKREMPATLPSRFAILTAENPAGQQLDAATNATRNAELRRELSDAGMAHTPTLGTWRNDAGDMLSENSTLIHDIDPAHAEALGRKYGQQAVITRTGYHDLQAGTVSPLMKTSVGKAPPYTQLPNGQRVGMSFDWKHTSPLLSANQNDDVMNVVRQFQRASGAENMPRVTAVDADKARQMADVYESLPKNDPNARGAYDALNAEVAKQYDAITKAGHAVQFVDKDAYANSKQMMADVRDNKTLKVLKTPDDNFHPYMTPEQNDKFRAVHDWFAHAGEGHSFGPIGEENAYRVHASTLSPAARQALATETRGQNSWVNFGPNAHLPVTQRPYAEQKAALFPQELTGDYGAMTPDVFGKVRASRLDELKQQTSQLDAADADELHTFVQSPYTTPEQARDAMKSYGLPDDAVDAAARLRAATNAHKEAIRQAAPTRVRKVAEKTDTYLKGQK